MSMEILPILLGEVLLLMPVLWLLYNINRNRDMDNRKDAEVQRELAAWRREVDLTLKVDAKSRTDLAEHVTEADQSRRDIYRQLRDIERRLDKAGVNGGTVK